MIRLRIIPDNGPEREVEAFEPSLSVGRAADCAVAVRDPRVDWKHGEILCRDGRVFYRDLRSRHGSVLLSRGGGKRTLENGLAEVEIGAGDRIQIGSAVIEVVSVEANLYAPAEQSAMPIVESRTGSDLDTLVRQMEKDHQVLEQIHRFERQLLDVCDLNRLFASISEAVFEVFENATHLFVALVEGEKLDLVLAARRPGIEGAEGPANLSRFLVDQAIENREALIFNLTKAGSLQLRQSRSREIDPTKSVSLNRIQSGICAPLWSGTSIVGVMEIDNRVAAASFSPEEGDLLLLFANRVALALEKHRRYSEHLEAARDAVIGQVVSKVVHDMTNHFGVLRPLTELTDQDLRSLEKHVAEGDLDKQGIHASLVSLRDRWQRMRVHHDLLWNLLDDLRHYAREREPEYTRVPVRDVVEVSIQVAECRARERGREIEFRVAGDPDSVHFLADAISVRRAVQNLLNNSVDAVPKGSRGVVEAGVEIVRVDGRRYVCFSVADDGAGVPDDLIDKIFDYGFSTKPGLSGSGFGLAVIKKVMKEHRGYIRLSSRKDEGTRVRLYFPAIRVAGHIRRYPDPGDFLVRVEPWEESAVPA